MVKANINTDIRHELANGIRSSNPLKTFPRITVFGQDVVIFGEYKNGRFLKNPQQALFDSLQFVTIIRHDN